MSKGLDALEKLRQNNKDNSHLFDDELLETIEKELKALEIIIDKTVNVYDEIYETNDYEDYIANFGYTQLQFNMTKEEYELVKEVFDYD